MLSRLSIVAVSFLMTAGFAGLRSDSAVAQEVHELSFEKHVQPILSNHCFNCHGLDEETRAGGLRLDLSESALGKGESGLTAIVPGAPDRSELIARLQAGTDNWWAPNGVIDYDFAGRLALVTIPLLLLNPRDDNLAAATRRAAALRPDAAYVEIDGADGAPMTHPEQFAAAVCAFLDAPA